MNTLTSSPGVYGPSPTFCVELVDADLERSAGVGAGGREGFDRLTASVAVGEVGVLLQL